MGWWLRENYFTYQRWRESPWEGREMTQRVKRENSYRGREKLVLVKNISFICTAYQTMNAEKSRPCKCKWDRINHVPKMSMRESLQNMQVACFNEFGGTQVKLLIWLVIFIHEEHGTWERLTQIRYKAMGIIRFREISILLCPSFEHPYYVTILYGLTKQLTY